MNSKVQHILNKLKSSGRGAFSSQDSKYFISTAIKLTLIPLVSFVLAAYSLWTLMEMNLNFFIAKGFESGEEFAGAYYDMMFQGVQSYIPYFFGIIGGVFFTGLFISWLVLNSFDDIENFSKDASQDPSIDFIANGFNKNKLINQVSRIFFKYLQICQNQGKRPRFKLPHKLANLNSPPFDKVFFVQYILIMTIICLATNIILYTFTSELYQQIVQVGIKLLVTDDVTKSFLSSLDKLLVNIYVTTISINIVLYFLVAKSVIKSVDGVSYGFSRDMLRVINGDHTTRLAPRFSDPGKGLAYEINSYLDQVFGEEVQINESVEEALDTTFETIQQYDAPDLPPDLPPPPPLPTSEEKLVANGEPSVSEQGDTKIPDLKIVDED